MTDAANAPRNMIFNGDCIDVMQAFDTGSIDFILTDPPYVINYRDRQGRQPVDSGRKGVALNAKRSHPERAPAAPLVRCRDR